jgi:hypothetical protein
MNDARARLERALTKIRAKWEGRSLYVPSPSAGEGIGIYFEFDDPAKLEGLRAGPSAFTVTDRRLAARAHEAHKHWCERMMEVVQLEVDRLRAENSR